MTYTMLPELKTCQRGHLKSERFPYMKNVIYVGQGRSTGDAQHLRNPAPGRQYRRHPAGRTEKPG